MILLIKSLTSPEGLDDVAMVSAVLTPGEVDDVAMVVLNSGVVGVFEGLVVTEVDLSVVSRRKPEELKFNGLSPLCY